MTQDDVPVPVADLAEIRGSGYLTNDEHTEIYLMLLQNPDISRGELARRGFEPTYVDTVMPVLVQRGLARPVAEDRWEPVPPDVALPAYASRLEEQARTVRASAPALTRAYSARSREEPHASGYTHLASMDDVGIATQRLVAGARGPVLGVRQNTPYLRYLMDRPDEYHRMTLFNEVGKAVSGRMVMDMAFLSHPRISQVLHSRRAAGERHQFASGVPFSALVSESTAVIDFATAGDGATGVMITDPDAVTALRATMQMIWGLSKPFRIGVDDPSTFDDRDVRVLQMLAGGSTDSTISRQLGISQRTVERRVRQAMDNLGAATRFQAGVLAAKAGLI